VSRILAIVRTWIEKFWYDFQTDCPNLAIATNEWLDEIVNDPESGGVDGDTMEVTGTAKVALRLKTTLDQMLNPREGRAFLKERSMTSVRSIFVCNP
jgi:hypothetical protein